MEKMPGGKAIVNAATTATGTTTVVRMMEGERAMPVEEDSSVLLGEEVEAVGGAVAVWVPSPSS